MKTRRNQRDFRNVQINMYSTKEQVMANCNHSDKRKRQVEFTPTAVFDMMLASSCLKAQPDDIALNNALPKVSLKLKYKRMTQPDHLIHHVPKVYTDDQIFNWTDRDYLLTNADRCFLHKLNARIIAQSDGDQPLTLLTEEGVEQFIDLMEKIAHKSKDLDGESLMDYFHR